jgi:prophage DNA circulation protein
MDRSQFRTVSYKGVEFLCVNSDNEFGRRLIVHEFPQAETPFIEDMGRMARRFSLNGFYAGPDWEQRWDSLIAVCESEGPGLLIHPEFGEISCAAESISVSEGKRDSAEYCDFVIAFVEAPSNEIRWEFVDTQQQLIDLQPDAFTSALNWLNDAALFVTEQVNDVFVTCR